MKIICIGRNYAEHAAELGNEVPSDMVIFLKPNTALNHNKEKWFLPNFSENMQYECEIVLKICKNGKHIAEKFAHTYYQELSLGVDFTARDLQQQLKEKGLPWEKAKAFDHSAIVGKFINKEDLDLTNLQFTFKKNNETVQQGLAKDMIYSFDKIIAEVSKYFTLQTGDLIYTGTPKGVSKVSIGERYEAFLETEKMFEFEVC
jgi:2-keto-4-pentenoate hydratase/2-oxohepta-3-ene-1,7-dioic acid hydratase in catechol pathway